jgi:hypothetical protein
MILKIAGVTSAIAAAGSTALTYAGFTQAGIAAASAAAGIQSTIGNVVAGSAFAVLQSAGMTGAIAGVGVTGVGLASPSPQSPTSFSEVEGKMIGLYIHLYSFTSLHFFRFFYSLLLCGQLNAK